MDVVPDPFALVDHDRLAGLDGGAHHGGDLDGDLVEEALADAVDGWGHDDCGWDASFEAGLDGDKIGGSLGVDLE